MISIAEMLSTQAGLAEKHAAKPAKKPTADVKKAFYASNAWKRLRYAALRANREKHGQLTCEACGSNEGPWHGDHIEAVSKNWSRRLDATNVQVLCERCNMGKSNTDSIDWR